MNLHLRLLIKAAAISKRWFLTCAVRGKLLAFERRQRQVKVRKSQWFDLKFKLSNANQQTTSTEYKPKIVFWV